MLANWGALHYYKTDIQDQNLLRQDWLTIDCDIVIKRMIIITPTIAEIWDSHEVNSSKFSITARVIF